MKKNISAFILISIVISGCLTFLYTSKLDRLDNFWIEQIRLNTVFNAGLTGKNVTIAVLDTGLDQQHPSFKTKNIQPGYDLVKNSPYPQDVDGHGTWVSGLIVGDFTQTKHYNSEFSGVAPEASIIPFRIGRTFDDQIESTAIRMAADTEEVDILVMSVGGRSSVSSDELNSLLYATKKGIIVVMAAGNGGADAPVLPAGLVNMLYPVAISVGSVDFKNKISKYSNRAGSTMSNFLVAPGDNLVTTSLNAEYKKVMGTSFSVPIVAGAVALLIEAFPDLPRTELVQALFDSATDLGKQGNDEIYGTGLLNISNAYNSLCKKHNSLFCTENELLTQQ